MAEPALVFTLLSCVPCFILYHTISATEKAVVTMRMLSVASYRKLNSNEQRTKGIYWLTSLESAEMGLKRSSIKDPAPSFQCLRSPSYVSNMFWITFFYPSEMATEALSNTSMY